MEAHEKTRKAKEEEEEAKRRAVPPKERLAAIQAILGTVKKTGFRADECGALRSELAYIPQQAPEHARGLAMERQILGLKKAADAKKVAEEVAIEKVAERMKLAEWRKQDVELGMTDERVLLSKWGRPDKINRSQYADRIHREQWCYDGRGFLYFEEGILTGIQN